MCTMKILRAVKEEKEKSQACMHLSLTSWASHFQKILLIRFNPTDGSNPRPENRPLDTNYYNQVSTDFEIEARLTVAGIRKQR